MLKVLSSQSKQIIIKSLYSQKRTFLTNSYTCVEAWNSRFTSSILSKVNLEEFYNSLDQTFSNKGVISAIDVDIYANSIKDAVYLEELRDLIHKLRFSADTGNTLDSTHHATVRNYMEFGNLQDLIDIVKDPLNYGIFLDDFSANILLDKLLEMGDFEKAAIVASQIMLQENFSNEITCALCQYACYKYISQYEPPIKEPVVASQTKVEEVKIRIKFLRNPYYDDHFDITDISKLSGKTLAWISESRKDNLNFNLEILGWLLYQKYDRLIKTCENAAQKPNIKLYNEVLYILEKVKSREDINDEIANVLQKCSSILNNFDIINNSIENDLKLNIENAINKRQTKDIAEQQKLFKEWEKTREDKLIEQTKRLDRTKRLQIIEDKQKELQAEEQKLWFFENEENIDLEIESKEKEEKVTNTPKSNSLQKNDENYIPPEIIPKRQ